MITLLFIIIIFNVKFCFCFRTLSILRENFDPVGAARRHELPSTNIIDVTEGCCQLAELLKIHLLSGMDKIDLRREINTTGLEMKTIAEKNAEQVIKKKKKYVHPDS